MQRFLRPLAAAALAAAPFLSAVAGQTLAAEPLAHQAADAERGAQVYERCAGCHSLDRNRVGPAHRGVFGRKAGAAPGYRYSKALAASDIVWDVESLDRWLADPGGTVPGSRMGYRLSDPQDRADVIAFLRAAAADKGN